MKNAQMIVLVLAGAAAVVAGGVATNEVLGEGKLSWHWAYLAFGFMVLASVFTLQATRPAADPSSTSTERRSLLSKRSYLRQVRASVNDMETIGVVTHSEFVLRMRQVYVDVSLRPRPAQDAAYDQGVGPIATEPVEERRSLQSFLSKGRVFAVIGASGSGKTTLVRHTALAMCSVGWRFWRRRQLPVLLYLRDHAKLILGEEPSSLADVATSAGWLEGKISTAWLSKRLDKGRCVILLDGLDEVADEQDRRKIVTWVRRQIERYPADTFVLTSRPYGYLSNAIPNADVLQVQRFTGDQISQFLHYWYYAVECRARGRSGRPVRAIATRHANDLLQKLRTGPAMYELAANPLLLTMIANVHRYRSALPRSRAALYSEMCDALIHRRQEAKNLTDATGLVGPKKQRVTQHLALHMMREQLRDIQVHQALGTIRRPLHQVTGEDLITPGTFLDEVRKSGLIVERAHGVCSFAHLTFQEYLAAAHIREQPASYLHLLTEGVDDPWWRETTLLWAAASDATPIIEACLASGTIHALTLAFDCADEALELATDTRARLNELLSSPDTLDQADDAAQERRRLIAAVTASRSLREVVWLGTTAVCTQPVTRDLFNLFVMYEQSTGRHISSQPTGQRTSGLAPAVGMWAEDGTRFVGWLNALFDDGTTYRLPTPGELTHPQSNLIPVLTQQTIWTRNGHRPILRRAGGVHWPYAATAEQLIRYPTAILENIRPALRVARIPVDNWRTNPFHLSEHALDVSHLVAYTHAFAAILGGNFHHQSVRNLTITLDRARELSRALNLALQLALELHRAGYRNVDTAIEIATSLHQALTFDLTSALGLSGGDVNAPSLDSAHTLNRELGSDLRHNPKIHRAISRACDLNRELDHALDSDPARDLERARDCARKHARTLDLATTRARARNRALTAIGNALTLDCDRARALDLDLDQPNELSRDLDLARARDVTRDLSGALARALAPDLDRERGRAHTLARARARDLDRALTRDLNRSVARNLARDLGLRYRELLPPVVAACRGLFRSWPVSASDGSAGDGKARTSFERWLTEVLETSIDDLTHAAEDPVGMTRQVLEQLRREPTKSEALILVEHTYRLIKPVMDRTTPPDRRVLVVAGAGLLAALALLQQNRNDYAITSHLARILGTLVVLADHDSGRAANEVLLLVRT